MTSPFADFANAEITFKVASATASGVDRLGNPAIATTDLVVTAMLKEKRSQPQGLPGTDRASIVLEGYLVSPLQLPSSLEMGSVGEILLKKDATTTIKGKFTLMPAIANPVLVAENIVELSKIKGLLQYP